MKEGVLRYMSGEEGVQQMGVAKGFEVNFFADEAEFPELISPVQLQVDVSMHAPNIPNSHGIAFDSWGNPFATDGSSGRAFQVRPDGEGFKMTELLKKEVRPVSAINHPDPLRFS